MDNQISNIKESVIELVEDNRFIHHSWFKKYHLDIVEQISLELCSIYKSADQDLVCLLVWLHDYEKITRNIPESPTLEDLIKESGFDQSLTDTIINYIEIIDSKEGLDDEKTPVEIKIVSSADGASHLTGPFFSIWFYDNPTIDIPDLMQGNIGKLEKDWDKKIVLPEIKKRFKKYYELQRDLNGIFPDSYLE